MKRTLVLLLVLVAVGGAAALAFLAVSGDGTPAPRVPAPRAGTAVPDASQGEPAAAAAGAPHRRRRETPPGVAADSVAVAGVVRDPQGAPIEGARVTCHVVPTGEPDDQVRMMRSMLGDLMTDGEIAEAQKQFGQPGGPFGGAMRQRPRGRISVGAGGGSGGPRAQVKVQVGSSAGAGADPAPDDDDDSQAAAARFGMDIGRRMMSDPGSMSRLMRSIQVVAAGFEDDALLPVTDETVTDAKGVFRFEALPAGARIELRATAARHQRAKKRVHVPELAAELELGPASILTGEVRSEGHPLPGAQVRLRTQTLTTGGNGRFVYAEAKAPREPVLVTAPGHAPAGGWATVPETGDPALFTIELFPAGTIRGRVTAKDGSPLRGAQVTILREGMSVFMSMIPGAQALAPPEPVVVSGADGSYVFEGLPSGKVKLRASRTGHLAASAGPFNVLPNETLDGVDFSLVKESSLTGRVTGPDDAPIADATVGVSLPAEGAMMKMAVQFMGGASATAKTDSDGRYRVGGVGEGEHDVYAEAEGHLRQTAQATLPAEAGATLDLTLRLGFEISGIVLAPDGTPAIGAKVRVTGPADLGGNPMMAALQTPVGRATTGMDGRFVVKGLPDGPYGLTARAKGFLDADAADVQPGTTDLTLRLGAAATIRGRVVAAADGRPVGGATVRYADDSPGGNPMMRAMRPTSSVAADADGTFEIAGIKAGAFTLSARGAGYAESGKTKAVVEAGAVLGGVELALPPGSAVGGHVVQKGSGAPVEGAIVYVSFDKSPMANIDFGSIMGGDPVAPPDSISAKTGADGAFLLEGLSPGKAVLEVRARGFAPLSVPGDAPTADLACEVSPGGAVEGTVYAKAGYPLEGATVMLQKGMMGAGFGGTATTDRAGHFRIDRLAPGSYQAILMDPESPMGFGGMKQAVVRDGETTTLVFNQKGGGRVITGDVLRDGKPLADAAVMLFGGTAGMQLGTADANGRFKFEGAEPGAYTVTVQTQMMGGGNVSAKVTVTADADPAPVRLELSGLAIGGVVLDAATGKGVAQAQVELYVHGAGAGGASIQDVLSRQRGRAFTNADGRFRLESVPQGAFDLRVVAADYAESELENVQPGADDVHVSLTKGLELTLTVTGPDDRPVVSAMVVPVDASGKEGVAFDMSASKQTGTDGVAHLRLSPGRYVLRVRAASYPEASVTVDAGQGAASVRIEDGGAIEVLAKTTTGPAIGAKVTILDAQGAVIPASLSMGNLFGAGDATDATGRAIRDGLRVGRVIVVVKSASGAETRSPANVIAGDVTRVEVTLSD